MKTVRSNTVGALKSKLKWLKGVVAGCGLLLMLPSAWAQFTSLPIYEPFGEYTNNNEALGSGETLPYWNVGNGGSNGVSSYIITNIAAISFPALVGDTNPVPKGVMSQYVNYSSADRGFMFTTHTGTIYASFLLNYIDNGVAITGYAQDRAILSLGSGASVYTNGSFSDIDASVWLTPDYRIVIDKNYRHGGAFSSPSPVIATNVPHLVVVRYQVNPGGNDEMDLWIDPMPFGDNGSIPPPTLSTTNGPNIANFNVLMLNSRKTPQYTANKFYVDEIRVGNTWSSVTPLATPPPGPIFTVTGGGIICPGSQTDVSLSDSVTTNVYLLYTNNTYAGVSLPGTGSALDLGMQSTPAVYSVLASNTVTADIGWMSNSVTVVAIPPPTIVTEPNPVVTATNNRAEFTVGLAGSGFSYQWYQDGTALLDNSNIMGAQTDDLVIWPATTANIGNYYCVISNTCGEASATTTNSLTLDAPNNLVWAGDSFGINVWGVGSNAVQEFKDPNNNSVYFNEGDNVTFNDSYNGTQYGTNITLTNILTPTSITYDTAQELTWAGPGSIAGSGSLLVDGSGTLNLLNNSADNYANTYTGGTVISNGTVNMHNSWTGLGTGPVTLAGGTLETYQKAKGSGLLQNLYVTADSTWQVDKTGNQCAGLAGALLGNPGTTLTISNSVSNYHSPNDIRFYGVFTNNSAIVTSIDPLATNSAMRIDAYNSTGTQVYNGDISGDTAAFFVYGAGAVYLNGANTYTNATTAASGFLAGSGSIGGPLIESSGGTLGGGPEDAIGTFTVNSDVTLGGNVLIRVDKSLSPAQSNDMISATGIITNTGTGTVTITNIGPTPLEVGDKFKIFSGPVGNADVLTVTGGGVTWSNSLAVDGSVQVVPGPTFITNSPAITSFSLVGANAVISGTNGQAGATAYLLMTTNVAEPPSQWKTVATNVLGGNAYTFIGTNVITADSPQQFFMLSSTNYNP